METNNSVWSYYQPGFVDPLYVPYQRTITKDAWGNEVSINTWQKQGDPFLTDPGMVRRNWGRRFMRMFDDDPCPPGWVKNGSYCVRSDGHFKPVFYTDDAFIAKNQYWAGYTDSNFVSQPHQKRGRRVSEQTDLRSVNPLTGEYEVYFLPSTTKARVRYVSPLVDTHKQYDPNWALPTERSYANLATKDSYLA